VEATEYVTVAEIAPDPKDYPGALPKILKPGALVFTKMCERAKLTWRPTPHHLKHSVASWFAMAGIPIDQAADWLATDPKTLRRVYRKFDPSYLRTVASALSL